MNETEAKEFIKIIWFNAKKMGVVSIGAYLIVESNTLLTSLFFDLKTVAAYGLTMQVINFALSLARIPFSTYLPMLNELRIMNNTSNFIRVMSTTFVFGGLIYWCCALIVIGFADNILILLKSKTMLLPSEMVAFMMLYLFLEYNHSNFASVITTRNEVPFVKSSIYSGIGVVMFSLFNVQVLDLELWGLLLGQCFAQLLYNNWHWPLVVLREFDVSLWFMFRTGMRELKEKLQLFFVRGAN